MDDIIEMIFSFLGHIAKKEQIPLSIRIPILLLFLCFFVTVIVVLFQVGMQEIQKGMNWGGGVMILIAGVITIIISIEFVNVVRYLRNRS